MICCVTGHRSKGFPFLCEETEALYREYLRKLNFKVQNLVGEGYQYFITGMAEGADLDFANCVLDLKRLNKTIFLEAALPFPVSAAKRKTAYNEQRDQILEQCDQGYVVSKQYYRGCMHKRNRYMVDQSDLVLAIWNGREEGGTWDTICYAKAKGKSIQYFMLTDLLS